jgi:hypothetical protein
VSWANATFLVVLAVAVAAWVLLNPAHRAGRAERKARRREQRVEAAARQEVFDALHRHHRTQRRLIMAGHDPNLAGPVRLPGQPMVPEQRQDGAGAASQPSEVGSTHDTP